MNASIEAQKSAEVFIAFARNNSNDTRPINIVCSCKKHSKMMGKVTPAEFIAHAFNFGISPATNAGMTKLNHAILEAN